MEASPSSNSNQQLIDLLESEMLDDIKKIDVAAENEGRINYELVKDWYFETEKLIRVIGNIFTVPLSQAINQLRYAGHHILKANLAITPEIRQQNIIEAYKHCKRAYYDAIDFYVYTLNEEYRVLLPYLDNQSASKIERIIREHLQDIHQFRLNSQGRIDYYRDVQKTIIRGLQVIESLNEIQRETGVSKRILLGKQTLIEENDLLKKHLSNLKSQVVNLTDRLNSRAYYVALVITIIIALATSVGLIADAFLTSKHEVVFLNGNNAKQ